MSEGLGRKFEHRKSNTTMKAVIVLVLCVAYVSAVHWDACASTKLAHVKQVFQEPEFVISREEVHISINGELNPGVELKDGIANVTIASATSGQRVVHHSFSLCEHLVYKQQCPLRGSYSIRVPIILPRDTVQPGEYDVAITLFTGEEEVACVKTRLEVHFHRVPANCPACGMFINYGVLSRG